MWCLFGIVVLSFLSGESHALIYRLLGYYEQDKRPIEEIRKWARSRSSDDILVLGVRRDMTSLPLLRQIAETPSPTQSEINEALKHSRTKNRLIKEYRDSSVAAKFALARMGERRYFDEFVIGLSTTSLDWRADCIIGLGYSGDKRAIKFLGPLLYQEKISGTAASPGAIYSSDADNAEIALHDLLPEIKRSEIEKKLKNRPSRPGHIWQLWWEENKNKYK